MIHVIYMNQVFYKYGKLKRNETSKRWLNEKKREIMPWGRGKEEQWEACCGVVIVKCKP